MTNFTMSKSRILKETGSIACSGMVNRVYVVALWAQNQLRVEKLGKKRLVLRLQLKTRNMPKILFVQILKYMEITIKTLMILKKKNIKYVNCHHLDSLPMGFLFKILKGSMVIYDTHELETERFKLSGVRKRLSKLLEKWIISYADKIIVVNDSIAQWYRERYSLNNISVVKNVPCYTDFGRKKTDILRKKFLLKDDEILYIYVGSLNPGRGIFAILEAFTKVSGKSHIAFIGSGSLKSLIEEYEEKFNNIHYQKEIRYDEISKYASSADIGIALIENECLSYYYCLPNKVFEYYMSGLPMIVSDFPEMGRFIDENNCGWKIPVNTSALIDIIHKITLDDLIGKRDAVIKKHKKYCWSNEEKILFEVFRTT
jgi:glycosyltransferase involved in cell wall biosynthesis